MNTENKKPGGRPKLASYQKRTRCFRVMFNENDYIYIQSKAKQTGLSVNEFCHLTDWRSQATLRHRHYGTMPCRY